MVKSLFFMAALAAALSFTLTLMAMPLWIRQIRAWQWGKHVRLVGPESHLKKQGTPTMGGAVFVAVMVLCALIIKPSPAVMLWSAMVLWFALLGAFDDGQGIRHQRSLGLRAWQKIMLQSIGSWGFYIGVVLCFGLPKVLAIPGWGLLDLGSHAWWLMPLWYWLIGVGVSNAVNLTDGLDGLASVMLMHALVLLLIVAGLARFWPMQGWIGGDLTLMVPLMTTCAALLAFLWYNAWPAKIFMGDTGSMALGAALAALALLWHAEWALLGFAIIPVIEALSVVIQVGYFKKTKRKFFKMAPIHHHFELLGWSETQVLIRFWIISCVTSALILFLYMR